MHGHAMRPPRLCGCRDGVEGMPLTLLVTAVVLAITVPLIFGSLRVYDRARTEEGLVSGIDDVIHAVQLVYTSGPGNSALVDFNAAPGAMTGIDYITFGDEPGGSMASIVRYKLQGRPESLMAVASPSVPMQSRDGTGFNISAGNHRVIVECASVQDTGTGWHACVFLELVQ